MRLLTNGIIMVMIVGDRPETVPVPLYEDQVDEEMDWEKQNPKITSLAQIKAKWPYLFDRDNLAHIPNLKFVETNHHDYEWQGEPEEELHFNFPYCWRSKILT